MLSCVLHLSALLQLALSPPLPSPLPPPQTLNPVLLSFTHPSLPKRNTRRHGCRGHGLTQHLHHTAASFLTILHIHLFFLLLLFFILFFFFFFFSALYAGERWIVCLIVSVVALRWSSGSRPSSHIHPEWIWLSGWVEGVVVQVSCSSPGWRCGSCLGVRLRESRRRGPYCGPRILGVQIGGDGSGEAGTMWSKTGLSPLQVWSFSTFQCAV